VLASSFETGGKLIKKTRAGERKFWESRFWKFLQSRMDTGDDLTEYEENEF
jgi:hypothetical protein